MENVICEERDLKYVLNFKGHIDSANANAIEDFINSKKNEFISKEVIIDAEHLEYISSAGLRIILRLLKDHPEIRIINVSKDVYDVFQMTGFTEMLPIEKAFRKLSVEGCEVIGHGSNGIVYRIDPDTIIKVYKNKDSLPDIKRETDLAHKALIMGIPTAIPYDVVKVGDTFGSVLELLNATSFSKILNADPSRMDECLTMYVDLLKKIHATHIKPGDMPDLKAVSSKWVSFLKDYLEPSKYEKLVRLMDTIPSKDTMIHGDYHTKNVMLQNGEVLLIDMDTLAMGHPVFEIASMYLAFVGFGEMDHSRVTEFMGLPFDLAEEFFNKGMALYLGTDDKKKIQNVIDKGRIIGYVKIIRRTIRRIGLDNAEGKKMVDFFTGELYSLLDKTDTLNF